jgi:hypothetical protein
MKRFTLIVCFIFLLLLLMVAVPAAADSPTINQISPAVGYTGRTTTVTITGSNFNMSSVAVKLVMDGQTNITASITSHTSTEIVCKFTLSSSKETGDWDLVVINQDGTEKSMIGGFSIQNPMVLTSISPTEARVNNDSVDFTLVGTGLSDVSDVFLYSKGDTNITAENLDASSSKVEGTFDLTDAAEDTYDVCVEDSHGTTVCDLSFEIITDAVGSVYFETNPDGATVYFDNNNVGTSTFTYGNASAGTYKVLIQKNGYKDYGGYVTVINGKRIVFYAKLEPLVEVTTVSATAATATPVKTATTIKKSTLKVPTTWPDDTPTTAASPVDLALVIGAAGIGLGLAAFRRL